MTNKEIILTEKDQLNRQLENIGWGVFRLMIGGIWLLPYRFLPDRLLKDHL